MRYEVIINRIPDATDIIPYYVGEERCAPSHRFGPHVRKVYLLHYCLSGCGRLYDKYGEHKIREGELFVIRPGETTTYVADEQNPWHYVWIAFLGHRAEIFNTDRSVYPCPDSVFRRISGLIEAGEDSAEIYTAIVHEIIYNLFSDSEKRQDTLSKIRKYIRYNFMDSITAESVCRLFGYERTYLYRIFKKRYGTGIKDYITKVRMENAKNFLTSGKSVCDTATLVGYRDEFNFSKAYKKYWGIPPSHARTTERA